MQPVSVLGLTENWKVANVIPIFKEGFKGRSRDYMPVSLTSIPGKIEENYQTFGTQALLKDSQHIKEGPV